MGADRLAVERGLSVLDIARARIESAAAPGGGGDEWPDPMPLPRLPAVPAFDLALLPDAFRGWIGDIASRARYAPDFPAVCAMAAIGSLIGRKLGIRPKAHDDWTEHANVWAAIVGPPSAMKSPGLRDALAPLRRLQMLADEQHAEAMREHAAALELSRVRKTAAKKRAARALAKDADAEVDIPADDEAAAPAPRTYLTSDSTVEKLGELLRDNPTGILTERDELSGFLANLDREEQAAARGFYLSGWSGKDGYRFDRIMRGTVSLPAFALSVVGGIQPGPLERYVRAASHGERADGLLQRFQLAVWPDMPEFAYVDRWPDRAMRSDAWALFERADTFDPEAIGAHDDWGAGPPFVRLDDAAQALFIEWYTAFMQKRRATEAEAGEPAALCAHFGKYPGLCAKLALILHVCDGNPDDAGRVSHRTLVKALAWLEYLEGHARRIYHAAAAPETDAAQLLLARIRRGEIGHEDAPAFSARDVYRRQWSGLGDAQRVKRACALLADYAWLAEQDAPARPGRPADPVYAVNPKARRAP